MSKLFTIGHSNHSLEKFIQLLEDQGIRAVVDVRSAPYSRHNPQFNRDFLESALLRRQIQYVYEGKHLGGRPPDPACYKSHKLPAEGSDYLHEVDYPAVMQREWFQKGIERLLALAEVQTTTILCSEEDPANCHRHHLIARYLMEGYPQNRGAKRDPDVSIQHIRGDGTVFNANTLLKSVNDQPSEQLSLF
jgi:uncharacterized protein (DUF488 family)